MRRRRNPIERRRARKPILLAWFIVAIATFVITPIAIVQLSNAHTFSLLDDAYGYSYSFDSTASDGDVRTALLQLLWSTATIFPLILGIVAVINGTDLNRSALARHGWKFRSAPTDLPAGRHHTFPLGVPFRLQATKLAWGPYGNRLASVYTYWTSSKYRYSIEQLELPASLPPVMLVPANAYDTLLVSVGGQDIHVESAAFNRRWRVMSPDAAAAHALLHPRMLERLMAHDLEDMAISFDGASVVSWWPGLTPVDRALEKLGVLSELADLIPPWVYNEFGEYRDPLWGDFVPAGVTPVVPTITPGHVPVTFHPE